MHFLANNEDPDEIPICKLIVFSMFMLLKLQTSAIKFVFSFIPNQSNSEVGNVTIMSDVVYNTY